MNTPILYALCGIPGAGKTTAAYKINPCAVVHSYDNVPGANRKADTDGSVFNAWVSGIKTDLTAGRDVVCDGTNLTVESRKRLLEQFADVDCVKSLVVLAVPVEECLRRNAGRKHRLPDFVITQSAVMMEAPRDDEGWDHIYLWRDDE